MKIDNKFLIFRTLAGYERAKDMIKESSIVFVIENRSIYTHGVRFGGESVDLSDYVTDDDLSDYIKKDEIDQYIPQQPSAGDNKKHIFLTQDEYDDLDGVISVSHIVDNKRADILLCKGFGFNLYAKPLLKSLTRSIKKSDLYTDEEKKKYVISKQVRNFMI